MAESILAEAARLVRGPRNRSYGDWVDESDRIARLWSVVLGAEVSDAQVTACMALLKIERAMHSGERDSLVDLAGYAELWAQLEGER